ncbi:MAG: hypothetical protein JWM95_582 [Gemmatimonadetes bacterium]|nr:hypothetical protein [Gemmatimonadota bacterium]
MNSTYRKMVLGLLLVAACSDASPSSAALATQLAITTQPDSAISGVPLAKQPIVEVHDSDGKPVHASKAVVTVGIGSGNGSLAGTTSVSAVNGVANFTNLRITGAGTNTLIFTSADLISATSASFTVAAPVQAPTQLAITTQPGAATSGLAFGIEPVIVLRDASGATVSGSTAAVTAVISSGLGTLIGATTVNAVKGVATFTNLGITGTGSFTLTFSSPGVPSSTSSSFAVASSGAFAPPNIATHDFNDGTFGPYTNDTPGHNSIIADPTGAGRGSVAQVKYDYPANGGGQIDLNQYFSLYPKTSYSYGSTVFFRGYVYFPANTVKLTDQNVLRKLVYWRTDAPNLTQCNLVVLMWGDQIMMNVATSPSNDVSSPHGVATLVGDQWTRVEMQVTMNSAAAVNDGIVRLWINGSLVWERLDMRLTETTASATVKWAWWGIGHQREGDGIETTVDERRYWDNVAFSTTRIGP